MKSLLIIFACMSIGFCAIAQLTLNIETGYVNGLQLDAYDDELQNFISIKNAVKGYSISLDVEQPLYEKIGLSLGIEYSKVDFHGTWTRSVKNVSFGMSTFSSTEFIEERLAIKSGFVFTILQHKKMTWKAIPLSNLYFLNYQGNPFSNVTLENILFGLTLKNRFQYRYSKDIQFLFSHAFDWTYYFNDDTDRHIFNLGISYDLD